MQKKFTHFHCQKATDIVQSRFDEEYEKGIEKRSSKDPGLQLSLNGKFFAMGSKIQNSEILPLGYYYNLLCILNVCISG
ncbi:hypothetical protein ACTXT7_008587 [Hymenolepis weldensis]